MYLDPAAVVAWLAVAESGGSQGGGTYNPSVRVGETEGPEVHCPIRDLVSKAKVGTE